MKQSLKKIVIDLCCGEGIYHEMLLRTFAKSILAHDINQDSLVQAWYRAIHGKYNDRIFNLVHCCLTELELSRGLIWLAFGTGVLGFLNDANVYLLF